MRKGLTKRAGVVLLAILTAWIMVGPVGSIPGLCGERADAPDSIVGQLDDFFGPERIEKIRTRDRRGFVALTKVAGHAGFARFASSFDRLAKILGTDRYGLFDNFASAGNQEVARFYWFAKTMDTIMRRAGGIDRVAASFRKLSGMLGWDVLVRVFKESPDDVFRIFNYIPHIDELIFLLGKEKISHAFSADIFRFLQALRTMSNEKLAYYGELERFIKTAGKQYLFLFDTPGIINGKHGKEAKKIIRQFVDKNSSNSLSLGVEELKVAFLAILAIYEHEFRFFDRTEYDAIAVRIIMNARFDNSYDADGSFLIGAPYVKSFSRAALVGVLAHEVAHNILPVKLETEAAHELIADLGNFSILTIMGYEQAIKELTLRYEKQVVDLHGRECAWLIEPHHAARTQLHIIRQVLGSDPNWRPMFKTAVRLARKDRNLGFAELVRSVLTACRAKMKYTGPESSPGPVDMGKERCSNRNHLLTAGNLRIILGITAAAK